MERHAMAITAAAVPTDSDLTEHAAAIHKLSKQTMENIVEIGCRLSECKRIIKERGESWSDWLKREFEWSDQTARRFIHVYEQLPGLNKLLSRQFPISALYLLAAPRTPPEARDEIVERAQAGEPVSVADIKQTIEAAKGQQQPAKRKPKSTEADLEAWNAGQISRDEAERRGIDTRPAKPALDDIGPDSSGEIARLQARVEELQADRRRLEIRIVRLESEVEESKPNGARALMASRQEPANSLDFFPTPPWATRALIERVLPALGIAPGDLARQTAWEMGCGEGHMAEVPGEYFGCVIATDLHDYGYGEAPVDFLDETTKRDADWGITNPPFEDKAIKFVLRALKLARVGVSMFVRLQWLETIERYEQIFRDHPPTLVAFFVERVNLCKGRWEPEGTTATAYCWLVWLRGESPRPPFWIPPGCREHLTRADDAARFTTHPVTRLSPADDGLDIPDCLRRTAS
jgi:hypothetical protein